METLRILRNKDLTLLLIGKLTSMLGSNVQQFALSLYVYALTGSATLFASMLAISILPRLLFSPFAGVFGDWFDRKKMIVSLDIFNGVMLLGFSYLLMVRGDFNLLSVYILVVMLEITEIFYESSSSGIVPSIVKQEKMVEARSLMSLSMSIARLASPMIGAALFGFAGLLVVLVFNAVSFLLSAAMELFIHVPPMHKRPEKLNVKSFFTDLKEGLKVVKDNKFIATIISLGTIVNFVIGPLFAVGYLVIIVDVLGGSEVEYGLYQTIMAISMVGAPILVAGYIKKFDIPKVTVISFMVVGVLVVSIAVVPFMAGFRMFDNSILPFALLMVISFFIGLSISVVNITIETLFAQIVPVHMMGRTSTVLNLLVTIMIPIGQMSFGFLFDTINPLYVILIAGGLLLVSIMVFRKRLLMASTIIEKPEQKSEKEGVAHAV